MTAFELYPELRYGEIDGIGTVTIDQTGNMVGFSPVERCTHNGQTTWIPTELVKNLRKEPFIPIVPAYMKWREAFEKENNLRLRHDTPDDMRPELNYQI